MSVLVNAFPYVCRKMTTRRMASMRFEEVRVNKEIPPQVEQVLQDGQVTQATQVLQGDKVPQGSQVPTLDEPNDVPVVPSDLIYGERLQMCYLL